MEETPYWTDHSSIKKTYTDKPLPSKTEILIIGGDYTGISAALRLLRAGVEVTLIDRVDMGGALISKKLNYQVL